MSVNDKLLKLLALAESSPFSNEAKIARQKYEFLLAKTNSKSLDVLPKGSSIYDSEYYSARRVDEFYRVVRVDGGVIVRRSSYLFAMILLYKSRINTFGIDYPSIRKDCIKNLKILCQKLTDEFGFIQRNFDFSKLPLGDNILPDNPDYNLFGNPDINYKMFLTDDEYSLIDEYLLYKI